MFKRIFFSSFFTLASVFAFADDAAPATQVDSSAVQAVSSSAMSSSSQVAPASSESEAPKWREVPVRYWVNGDSSELEAIFVKIENDTVFLKSDRLLVRKVFNMAQFSFCRLFQVDRIVFDFHKNRVKFYRIPVHPVTNGNFAMLGAFGFFRRR